MRMIDEKKYEGHTEGPWKQGGYEVQAIKIWTVSGFDETENWLHAPRADYLLAIDAPLLLAEVKRLREALITVQHSLIWDEKDRAMDGDPITLEALVAQVEEVRSDITEMIE